MNRLNCVKKIEKKKKLKLLGLDNRLIETIIRNDLCHYVLMNVAERNINEKTAVMNYLASYELSEDDWSFDAAYKCFRRWKKSSLSPVAFENLLKRYFLSRCNKKRTKLKITTSYQLVIF